MDRMLKRATRRNKRRQQRNGSAWRRFSPDGTTCRYCKHDHTKHLTSSGQPHFYRPATEAERRDPSVQLYRHTLPPGRLRAGAAHGRPQPRRAHHRLLHPVRREPAHPPGALLPAQRGRRRGGRVGHRTQRHGNRRLTRRTTRDKTRKENRHETRCTGKRRVLPHAAQGRRPDRGADSHPIRRLQPGPGHAAHPRPLLRGGRGAGAAGEAPGQAQRHPHRDLRRRAAPGPGAGGGGAARPRPGLGPVRHLHSEWGLRAALVESTV